jgi:hypothetical protein
MAANQTKRDRYKYILFALKVGLIKVSPQSGLRSGLRPLDGPDLLVVGQLAHHLLPVDLLNLAGLDLKAEVDT